MSNRPPSWQYRQNTNKLDYTNIDTVIKQEVIFSLLMTTKKEKITCHDLLVITSQINIVSFSAP